MKLKKSRGDFEVNRTCLFEEVIDDEMYRFITQRGLAKFGLYVMVPLIALFAFCLVGVSYATVLYVLLFVVCDVVAMNGGRFITRVYKDSILLRYGFYWTYYQKRIRLQDIREHRVISFNDTASFFGRGPTLPRATRFEGRRAICLGAVNWGNILYGGTVKFEHGVLIRTDQESYIITSEMPDDLDTALDLAQDHLRTGIRKAK